MNEAIALTSERALAKRRVSASLSIVRSLLVAIRTALSATGFYRDRVEPKKAHEDCIYRSGNNRRHR